MADLSAVEAQLRINKSLLLWMVIIGLLLVVLQFSMPNNEAEVSLTDFKRSVADGEFQEIIYEDGKLAGLLQVSDEKNKKYKFTSLPPYYTDVIKEIETMGTANITIKPSDQNPLLPQLMFLLPILLLGGYFIYMMRQMQSGSNKAMSFGKSKAQMVDKKDNEVTFGDVAGVEEAKEELEETVDFLKQPEKYERLGAKVPKGVLLVGPPGTGKTLLARAVAGEAEVPFFHISGSDFVEMFVGVGASRVRDLFDQAKRNSPCIVFIDEIDAVGRQRGAGMGGGHDEREQTLNQMLVEMDGFQPNQGIIVMAATNRDDVLDPALLRPGRFDRKVHVGRPDIEGRKKILEVHIAKVPKNDDVDLELISRATPGMVGADLANLINEAALVAARLGRKSVTMADFEYARDKIFMGKERKSHIMTPENKKMTAYHEAGHAVVAIYADKNDPVHKVSIMPRGNALGVTWTLPTEDRDSASKSKLEDEIAKMLGGWVAEDVFFGDVSTGSGNDIQRATQIARHMVCDAGMSSLGTVSYSGGNDGQVFLGRDYGQRQQHSDETARQIDLEVKSIIDRNLERARTIIKEHKDKMIALGEALIEKETVDLHEVYELVRPEVLDDILKKSHLLSKIASKSSDDQEDDDISSPIDDSIEEKPTNTEEDKEQTSPSDD